MLGYRPGWQRDGPAPLPVARQGGVALDGLRQRPSSSIEKKQQEGQREKTIINNDEERPVSGTLADRLPSIRHQHRGASSRLLQASGEQMPDLDGEYS